MTEDVGFEASLDELERAVSDLESGSLDLDGSLAAFERGVRLLARCKGLLDLAERKVALLVDVDDEGRPSTADFDAASTLEEAPGLAAKKPGKGAKP